jgi:hypothetical protein
MLYLIVDIFTDVVFLQDLSVSKPKLISKVDELQNLSDNFCNPINTSRHKAFVRNVNLSFSE